MEKSEEMTGTNDRAVRMNLLLLEKWTEGRQALMENLDKLAIKEIIRMNFML